MKTYSKPVVTIDIGLAEGVYAASGCYTASAYIHQTPQTGRGDYRIQVNYVSGGAGLISGNGTLILTIKLSYHQNPNDNIGFGDLVVTSDPGLAITGVSITD